jgi:hypothetical protein
MSLKPLEEELKSMGLSEDEIRRSLVNMAIEAKDADGDSEEESSKEEQSEEDEVNLDDYLDDNDEEGQEDEEGGDDEEGEDDEVDEAAIRTRIRRGTAASRRTSRQYYKTHRAQVKRQRVKFKKSARGKRHAMALKRGPKGGTRVRRIVKDDFNIRSEDSSLSESLIQEIAILAESIDRDPVDRFNEYAQAFNYIADLGELLALRYMGEEDEKAALGVLDLTVQAEDILKAMDKMEGAVTVEQDEKLERILSKAMDEVAEEFEIWQLIESEIEGDEEEDLDEDESLDDAEDVDEEGEGKEEEDGEHPFPDAVDAIAEAKRGKKQQRRMLLSKPKKVGGSSKWGRAHKGGATKRQIALRGDVRNPEALLGYLKKVKAGKVAPGQPIMTGKGGKPLSRTARAAVKAKGKGYKGKGKKAG